MTREQKELIAKKLCEKRGIDPYWMTPHGPPPNPDGSVNAVLCHSPAWKLMLSEIDRYLELTEAISEVMGK